MSKATSEDVVRMDENEFVAKNHTLVHKICQKIYSDKVKCDTGLEYDDLYQIGLLALVKAKRRFKPEYGWQFSTYAVHMIRGEILRQIRDSDRVHIPRPAKDAYLKIVCEGLLNEDDETIAEKLQMKATLVKRAKLVRTDVSSINELINKEEGDATVEDMLSDHTTAADIAETNVTMQEFLSTLTEKERMIWEEYRKDKTQTEIGKSIGVNQAHVCRVLKKIFNKAEKFGRKLMVDS